MTTHDTGPWEGVTIADGRYQRLTTIGCGGMAFVYRAFDARLNCEVVIKVPRPAMMETPSDVARFESEIAALIKLAHPNIVPVIDLGRHDGFPFAVMRHMSGGSLQDQLKTGHDGEQQPKPVRSLAAWLPSIAKALDFVHTQQVLHRDVKPGNILFDQHGNAFLSDFGIMKAIDASDATAKGFTSPGLIVGSVEYMAPEILRGQAADGRSDQYALASTVFEALAGRPPYIGESVAAVMTQHLVDPIPSLTSLAPHVSADVAATIERSLAKHPDERHPNCAALVAAMARAASNKHGAEQARQATSQLSATVEVSPSRDTSARGQTLVAPAPMQAGSRLRAAATSGTLLTTPSPLLAASPVFENVRPRLVGSLPVIGWVAIAAMFALFGGAAMWMAGVSSPAYETDSASPESLSQQMDSWEEHAADVERVLLVDSRKVLDRADYRSAEELEWELTGQATPNAPTVKDKLDALRHELDAIDQSYAKREKATSEQLADFSNASGTTAPDWLMAEQRTLQQQQTQLAAMKRTLAHLQQTNDRGVRAFDAAGTAELTVLREMEAALSKSARPTFSSETLKRLTQLAELPSNETLSRKAWLALIRTGHAASIQRAIDELPRLPADRQFDVGWSLLINGQPAAVAAVEEQFNAHSELPQKLPLGDLLLLVDSRPEDYASALASIGRWCNSLDERLRVFKIQAPRMTTEQAAAVEHECRDGILHGHVGDLLAIVVAEQTKPSYALMEKLLDEHPATAPPSVTSQQLASFVAAEPALGARVVEQTILQGSRAQRETALALYGNAKDSSRDAIFLDRIKDTPTREPETLTNLLIVTKHPRDVALAERLLASAHNLNPQEVQYRSASDAMLASDSVRGPLMALAARGSEADRAWAMEQWLGADGFAMLRDANSAVEQQITDSDAVTTVLDGNLVELKLPNTKVSQDRGLAVKIDDFPKLPRDIDPKKSDEWSDSQARLTNLVERMDAAKPSELPSLATELESFARYVKNLDALHKVAHRLASTYDVTVLQQLPGAKRSLMASPTSTWNFRFAHALMTQYHEDRVRYASLKREVRADQKRWESLLRK
jgi:serine/threonine protein kinase